MEYIETGLEALVEEVRRLDIQSIAIPPLGCGLGGLEWREVRPRIELAFTELPNVRVLLFEPKGAPTAEEMAKEQQTPNMTEGRALLLALMRRYLSAVMDPFVTLLEIHKLMYFMQESGQNLRLDYTKGPYGPYAENLRHVLTHIEGHFIIGYGDAADNPDKSIEPKAEAITEAEKFLKNHPKVHVRLDQVAKLIEGFETPYGMELLATMHWVTKHDRAVDLADATQKVYAWNDRKKMFKQKHLQIAWNTLEREGWFSSTVH
jgi:O-acetyl-ADP-ribose deacetylase (regulator of RNase III)